MGIFSKPKKSKTNVATTVKMVDSVIRELGLDPDQNRLQTESGGPAWGLMKGSAEVFIFINTGDGDSEHIIQVVSPVIKIPSSPHPELYQRLLVLNAGELTGAAFGIKGDAVVLTADRSTTDLDPSEVKDMILRIGYYADLYDDFLVNQFGGKRHSD